MKLGKITLKRSHHYIFSVFYSIFVIRFIFLLTHSRDQKLTFAFGSAHSSSSSPLPWPSPPSKWRFFAPALEEARTRPEVLKGRWSDAAWWRRSKGANRRGLTAWEARTADAARRGPRSLLKAPPPSPAVHSWGRQQRFTDITPSVAFLGKGPWHHRW